MEHKIVGDDGEPRAEVQKNFWSYIKATKKDRVSTPPLKDNGILISDSKCKSEILNRQYQSINLCSVKRIRQPCPPQQSPHHQPCLR